MVMVASCSTYPLMVQAQVQSALLSRIYPTGWGIQVRGGEVGMDAKEGSRQASFSLAGSVCAAVRLG